MRALVDSAPVADVLSALSARVIPIYGRGGLRAFAIVDAGDFDRFAHLRWNINQDGYAKTNQTYIDAEGRKRQRTIFLHREVLELVRGDGHHTDHINRDKLDCRRSNLRVVTHAQNHQNRAPRGDRGTSSSRRGVSFRKDNDRWQAYGVLAGVQQHLGFYDTENEAGEVAAAWRREHMPFSTN